MTFLESLWDFKTTYPNLSFLVMNLIYCWLGHSIVTQYLMEKQIRNPLPKVMFILTFTCSCSLLSMYIYEIIAVAMPQIYWDLILSVLVCLVVIVNPICLICKMPYASFHFMIWGKRIPIIGILYISLYIRFLSHTSTEIYERKNMQMSTIFQNNHLNVLIEIVVNYGIYLMAMMSAYGAVWCPYIYFNYIRQSHRMHLKNLKDKTQDEIQFIIEQIKKEKYKLLMGREEKDSLEEEIRKQKEQKEKESMTNKIWKTLTNFGSQNKGKELKVVQQKMYECERQIEQLKVVHQQSFSIYKYLKQQQKRLQISKTLYGRFVHILSFILAAYSITRIILTAWNMIKGRTLSTDPITRFLNFITFIWGSEMNKTVMKFSQTISFVFMGYLMISNVRSFSMNIKNFFEYVLRRRKFNLFDTDTLGFLYAEMYGVYFLAAVILIQSSLPRTYVTNFQQITGKVDLVEHFTLFDKLFFFLCIFSALLLLFTEYERKHKMNLIIKERNIIDIPRD